MSENDITRIIFPVPPVFEPAIAAPPPRSLRDCDLAQFIGTEAYWRFMPHFYLTDGAKYLLENGLHWLLVAIWSYQPEVPADMLDIQFWRLEVFRGTQSAVLTGERDSGDVRFRQVIEFTDCPLAEVRVWVVPLPLTNDPRGRLAMLPSEH